MINNKHDFFAMAYDALLEKNIDTKVSLVEKLSLYTKKNKVIFDIYSKVIDVKIPGRPDLPKLVQPKDLARSTIKTPEGRAILMHSIAHIEFNAINIALDAITRFRNLPELFYKDWLQVAVEESFHFNMVKKYLNSQGYDYGDFNSHNGLWDLCLKTNHSVIDRMALVPRIMEARGLDMSNIIGCKFNSSGLHDASRILNTILKDEIGHVWVGNFWYKFFCAQKNIPSFPNFKKLLIDYDLMSAIKGPFSIKDRIKAGFSLIELNYLCNQDKQNTFLSE